MVTYEGGNLIQCFDESFAHKDGFFVSNRHFHSEFYNVRPAAEKRLVSEFDLKKAISQDDHLVIISNYTLSVSIYDREHSLIREFSLKQNRDFFQDFKKRASLLKRKSATATILPFSLYLDNLGNICLGYFKGANNYVIYRYLQSGQHMDTLVASDDLFPPFVSDGKGFLYALKKDRSTLIKYRIGGNFE
ncbi:MAG: hypothetical protein SCM96_09255 [Acidobacteriota bacterium]|nr:hypothetical protein [Acidobacteriota bacterium]